MSKKLVIYGIGETAEIAYEYFTYDSAFEVVAFTVDGSYLNRESLFNLPVIGFEEIEDRFGPKNHQMFVAVSYTKLNRVRAQMYTKAKAKSYKLASYISSHAFVWRNVTVGDNVFIFENNVLQPNVKIGNNVILWSGNHIGHQTVIEDHVYLSSHCVVSGYCRIGASSFLGVNCTFNDNITLGEDNIVGSGALIVRNTEAGQLMIGAPAKPSSKTSYQAFDVENT
jgi:sugar O-acyltransferase (sialic acid O-acetyltransferase NeuD family)